MLTIHYAEVIGLSVVMQIVNILSVVMLRSITLSVFVQSVELLSVFMLSADCHYVLSVSLRRASLC